MERARGYCHSVEGKISMPYKILITANKTVIAGKEDANHFDPNYFAGAVKWQLPDIAQSELHCGGAR